MKVVVAFISDRGELYLPDCVRSFWHYRGFGPSFNEITTIDDREHNLGMAGAVRAAWSWARELDADYLIHVEEDFRFTQPFPTWAMIQLLYAHPHLAQMALKRQPWSRAEKDAGDILHTFPHVERACHVEQMTLFTLNPCVIPRRTLELEWSDSGRGVERDITDACLAAGMTFAYYGRVSSPPRCEHVGHERGVGWRY